jgi:ABC-type sugar transport system ATPase subunit
VLADRTTILVTHDVVDALTLADRAIVMNGGRVVEQGSPRDLIERPRTAFMAQLAGLNFFTGERRGDVLHTDDGLRIPLFPWATAVDVAAGRWVAVIPPALIGVHQLESLTPEPETAPAGHHAEIVDTILDVEPHGDTVRVRAAHVFADLPLRAWATLGVDAGDRVVFTLPTHDVVAFPATATTTGTGPAPGTAPTTPGVL